MSDTTLKIGILEQDDAMAGLIEAQLNASGMKNIVIFSSSKLLLSFLQNKKLDRLFISSPVKDYHWLTLLRNLVTVENGCRLESILILGAKEKIQHDWLELIRSYGVNEVLRKPLKVESLMAYFEKQKNEEVVKLGALKDRLDKVRLVYQSSLQNSFDELRDTLNNDTNKLVRDQMQVDGEKIADLQAVIQEDPENYNFHFRLLAHYFEQGQLDEFNEILDSLLNQIKGAERGFWLSQLAEVCLESGLHGISEFIADIIEVECEPKYCVKSAVLKSQLLLQRGQVEEAEEFSKKAAKLALEPSAELCVVQALIARKMSKHKEALSFLQIAKGLSPYDHRIPYQIALCFKSLGQVEEALDQARASLKIYSKFMKANNLVTALTVE